MKSRVSYPVVFGLNNQKVGVNINCNGKKNGRNMFREEPEELGFEMFTDIQVKIPGRQRGVEFRKEV